MANNFEHIFELRKDGSFVVKVPLIRVYVPEDYLDHDMAEIIDTDINIIALFNFDVYGEDPKKYDEDNPYKHPVRYFMKIPTYMWMCPTEILKERNDEKKLITILEFYQGDTFFKTVNVIRDWKIVNKVIELLIKGFIPKELPYDEVSGFITDCCIINNMDLEVNDTVIEILVAELSRNPNNIAQAFRHMIAGAKEKVDMKDRELLAIDRLGRINNTFAAISSNDVKYGVSTSVIRTKKNKPQKESSIEKVLTQV